jgi:hypothetical protein
MAAETVAGTVLSCSAAIQYSIFSPGYDGVVFSAIGEVTDIAGSLGREYNASTHAPISQSQVTARKGGFNYPAVELLMAWDESDAGQDLLRAASLDTTELTFELVKQDGDIRYFTAQVSKFVENCGTVDNVVVGAVTLLLQDRSEVIYEDFFFRRFIV